MRTFLLPMAALAICASSVFVAAEPADSPTPTAMSREPHWAADHAAMLDASLAGLRAGLKLTPDQEKLWPPFETAVRDATKLRMEQMRAMFEHAQKMHDMPPHMMDMDHADHMRDLGDKDLGDKGMDQKDLNHPAPAFSPVDRLDAIAQRMSDRGAALKKVADAAKPLYASLDDSQRRLFSLLGGDMLLSPHGHHGMRMMGPDRDMMRDDGRGMMRHEPFDDQDGYDDDGAGED